LSDRKYRHQGYQDSDRDRNREKRPDRPAQPKPPSDMPRPGRGMEGSANEVYRCSGCGTALPPDMAVTPEALCVSCFSPLHCCRNCNSFDSSARFECRQPIPAPMPGKSTRNECNFFQMRAVLDATGRRSATAEGGPPDPRKAFDALFKK
jgi:hypothetical protein